MAKKCMKKFSLFLATKERQIEITLRFHLTTVRIPTLKNASNNKCWQGYGQKATLIHFWWECKLVQPQRKTVWRLLKRLKIELPYDTTILHFGIYPKKCESSYSKSSCIPMFIVPLFTITKLFKQPR
jgi:hypothetical protein